MRRGRWMSVVLTTIWPGSCSMFMSVQRMLALLELLLMADQMHDLVLVAADEVAGQGQRSRRVFVLCSVTCLAHFFMGVPWRSRRPLPSSLVKYRATLRADRRFGKFKPRLVRIVDVLANHSIHARRAFSHVLFLHRCPRSGKLFVKSVRPVWIRRMAFKE